MKIESAWQQAANINENQLHRVYTSVSMGI